MKKAVLITILIAIGLIVAGGAMSFVSLAAAGFDIKNLFNISVSGADLNTVDITEDYTDLELKIDSDSIEIFKSSDENTHFTYYATDVHDYDVKVEENTLKIESLDKSASIKDIFVFHIMISLIYIPYCHQTMDYLYCASSSTPLIRLTPADELCSLTSLKCPSSPVLEAWGPPQISLLHPSIL